MSAYYIPRLLVIGPNVMAFEMDLAAEEAAEVGEWQWGESPSTRVASVQDIRPLLDACMVPEEKHRSVRRR